MSDEIKQRIVYVLTRTNKADNDDSDIYVGSTSMYLSNRLALHRCDAIRPGNENNRLYIRMREVGLENWEIHERVVLKRFGDWGRNLSG